MFFVGHKERKQRNFVWPKFYATTTNSQVVRMYLGFHYSAVPLFHIPCFLESVLNYHIRKEMNSKDITVSIGLAIVVLCDDVLLQLVSGCFYRSTIIPTLIKNSILFVY